MLQSHLEIATYPGMTLPHPEDLAFPLTLLYNL